MDWFFRSSPAIAFVRAFDATNSNEGGQLPGRRPTLPPQRNFRAPKPLEMCGDAKELLTGSAGWQQFKGGRNYEWALGKSVVNKRAAQKYHSRRGGSVEVENGMDNYPLQDAKRDV